MDMSRVLWVDLRMEKDQSSVHSRLGDRCQVHYIADMRRLGEAIRNATPRVACFEYDRPELPGLQMLQQTKLRFPSLPILMLTEHHSEALAVWAFRTRVWDYLVKPVPASDVLDRVALLSQLCRARPGERGRQNRMPLCPVPIELRFSAAEKKKRTSPAVSYVDMRFQNKIRLVDVAALCQMHPSTFSRAFKKDHGVTFSDYLMRYRINKAKELLGNTHAGVAEIAFAVGFRDSSYFTRMFRRILGVYPSSRAVKGKVHYPSPRSNTMPDQESSTVMQELPSKPVATGNT